MNETHDPGLRSWIESANSPTSDFPIQNLPYGVCFAEEGAGSAEDWRRHRRSDRRDLARCRKKGAWPTPERCEAAAVQSSIH
jgi:hypothetical protein